MNAHECSRVPGQRSAVLSRRLAVELDGVSTHREAVRAWASATRLLAAELGEGERSRVLLEVAADLSVLQDAFPGETSACVECAGREVGEGGAS